MEIKAMKVFIHLIDEKKIVRVMVKGLYPPLSAKSFQGTNEDVIDHIQQVELLREGKKGTNWIRKNQGPFPLLPVFQLLTPQIKFSLKFYKRRMCQFPEKTEAVARGLYEMLFFTNFYGNWICTCTGGRWKSSTLRLFSNIAIPGRWCTSQYTFNGPCH